MEQQQKARRVIAFAVNAGIVITALVGAGFLYYGKTSGDEMFTLFGYIVLTVSALDWAAWELFLKERLFRDGRDTDASRR